MKLALLLVAVAGCGSSQATDTRDVADTRAAFVPDAAVAIAVPIDATPEVTVDAPPPLPALEMRPMPGAFAALKNWCGAVTAERLEDGDPDHDVTCDFTKGAAADKGPTTLAKPAGSFLEAKLFVAEALDRHCQLGIRTSAGWYVLLGALRCLGSRSKSTLSSRVLELAVVDVFPGAAPVLRLRASYAQSTEDYDPDSFSRTTFETLVLCGIGPSGLVSCTRELVVSGTNEDHERGKKTVKTKLAVTITPGAGIPATLTIEGDTSTLPSYLSEPLAPGTYTVTFPSIITPAQWRAQPWANGRGVTHELLRRPDDRDYDVRLAVADIAEAAPFSRFAGYDRWLAPSGPVTLILPDGRHPLTLGDSIRFSGDEDASCEVAAPQWDLNLIVRRELAWSAQILDAAASLELEPALLVAFVLAGTVDLEHAPADPDRPTRPTRVRLAERHAFVLDLAVPTQLGIVPGGRMKLALATVVMS